MNIFIPSRFLYLTLFLDLDLVLLISRSLHGRLFVNDLRCCWCGSLRMVGLLHHEKPLVSPHLEPLLLSSTNPHSYLSHLHLYSCKAAEKADVDAEAPAHVETKPQIVRVNSGNRPINDMIQILQ